ncbi:MAG: septum formation protein Maf [candidate division Zixibacteria bacterium 4484_95]|nr:MAG: septum formation protein Maf [candidate division Zixibacteria bacterium 4484_95]
MKIILASSSPRRFKLLMEEGYKFEVVSPDVDEIRLPAESPQDYVRRLALVKARSVLVDKALVIGADTVVVLGDEFLNKPSSELEAKVILEKLSGNVHTVYTGLSMICSVCGKEDSDFDKTIVHFNYLTEKSILKYIESGEPMDKAGAYGIQGMGSFLVKKIEGKLDTVIGFPKELFKKMLKEHEDCLKV